MMIHVYLPHSDRQVDWIGRSRPFKNCWGFGINTFLVISFKSWVTGFPPAPSFFCSHAVKIFQDGEMDDTRLWRSRTVSLSLCWKWPEMMCPLYMIVDPRRYKNVGYSPRKKIGLKWWPLTFERGFRALNSWLLTSEAEISLPTTFLNFLC